MHAPQTLRTFIALPLCAPVTAQLADVQRKLKRLCPERSVRWVDPTRIHLTLFFIGDIRPQLQPAVETALAVVSRNIPPFSFDVQGVGAFPNVNRPRVLWVGLKEDLGYLVLLHRAVNEAMQQVGFHPEERPFSPHLTLGRISRQASRDAAQAVGESLGKIKVGHLGLCPAQKMIFYRSDLKSTGAEYTPLATFDLGAPAKS